MLAYIIYVLCRSLPNIVVDIGISELGDGKAVREALEERKRLRRENTKRVAELQALFLVLREVVAKAKGEELTAEASKQRFSSISLPKSLRRSWRTPISCRNIAIEDLLLS